MSARWRPSPRLILAALPALLVLTSCAARPAIRAAVPALPPLPASADATDVARYHLGGESFSMRLEQNPGGSPYAFWLVRVEATPTAQGAADALAFLGRRYGGGGRILQLSIRNNFDVQATQRVQWVHLYWNPTGTGATTLGPPYALPPHSIYVLSESRMVWNDWSWREEDPEAFARSTISGVTTEALAADSVQHRLLVGKIRTLAGLR